MSTARRKGTNEHVTTYGTAGAGRRYTSLATWEGIYDVNLTTIWKVAITNKSGNFNLDETLAFAPSGATGTYIDDDGSWMIFVVTGGTPAVNDVITGATSLKTATLSSITFSNGVSPVLECYDDAASFNDYVTIAGATTNATYFRIIRPGGTKASGWQGNDGTPNNGVSFFSTTDADMFSIGESYTQVQDLIGKITINTTTVRAAFSVTVANAAIVGCIATDSNNAGTGASRGFFISNGFIIDSLAHNIEPGSANASGFFSFAVAGVTSRIYNSTSQGGTQGFRFGNTGTHVMTNCLATGNTTDFVNSPVSGTVTITYCASGDATADDWGGAGNRISQTFTFVNSGGDDFHLASNDAGALSYGTDLSADGTYPFNDDIDFDIIISWDIGFDAWLPREVDAVTVRDIITVQIPAAVDLNVQTLDSLTANETNQPQIATLLIQLLDTLTGSDLQSTLLNNLIAQLQETLTTNDIPQELLNALLIQSIETITTSDIPQSFLSTFIISLIETVTESDVSQSVLAQLLIQLSETIQTADLPQSVLATLLIQLAETITANEIPQELLDKLLIQVQEALTASDIPQEILDKLLIQISDILTVSDSFNVATIADLFVSMIETLTSSDASQEVLNNLLIQAIDILTSSDVPQEVLNQLLVQISDFLSANDLQQEVISPLLIQLIDQITQSDASQEFLNNLIIQAIDTLTASDTSITTIAVVNLIVSMIDTLTANDIPIAPVISTLIVSIIETLVASDTFNEKLPTLIIQILETLSSSDVPQELIDRLRIALSETVTVSETLATGFALNINLIENVALNDVPLTNLAVFAVSAQDNITGSESFIPCLGDLFVRKIENLNLSEETQSQLNFLVAMNSEKVSISDVLKEKIIGPPQPEFLFQHIGVTSPKTTPGGNFKFARSKTSTIIPNLAGGLGEGPLGEGRLGE